MTISTVKNCERSENLPCGHVWVLSCIWLFETLQTVAHQAFLFMEFSRQEYWSGLLFPFLRDLHNPGIEPASPESPALAGRLFTTVPPGKPYVCIYMSKNIAIPLSQGGKKEGFGPQTYKQSPVITYNGHWYYKYPCYLATNNFYILNLYLFQSKS